MMSGTPELPSSATAAVLWLNPFLTGIEAVVGERLRVTMGLRAPDGRVLSSKSVVVFIDGERQKGLRAVRLVDGENGTLEVYREHWAVDAGEHELAIEVHDPSKGYEPGAQPIARLPLCPVRFGEPDWSSQGGKFGTVAITKVEPEDREDPT